MVIDVTEIVNKQLHDMEVSGVIERYIKEQTEKTVMGAIEDAFSSYRFKRSIEEKIEENFPDIVNHIGLSAYNTQLTEVVKKLIMAKMEEDAGKKLVEAVNGVLDQKLDKIAVSDILKRWREHVDCFEEDEKRERNEDDDGFTCALKERVRSGGSGFKCFSIYLDHDGNKDFDDVDDIELVVRLKMCWWKEEEKKTTIEDIFFRGTRLTKEFIHHTPDRFEQFLLNLYLNKTQIIMDVENCDENDHYYDVEGDY